MKIDFEMFIKELKEHLSDKRESLEESHQFLGGRLKEIDDFFEFIERYQKDRDNTFRDIASRLEKLEKKPYSNTEPITERADRCGRQRERLVIVDGKNYVFKSGQDMLEYFGLMDYYGKFMHLFQCKGGRENLVEYEANALRKLLYEKKQMHLESYTAHGFDGFAKTVMFDNEEKESANA